MGTVHKSFRHIFLFSGSNQVFKALIIKRFQIESSIAPHDTPNSLSHCPSCSAGREIVEIRGFSYSSPLNAPLMTTLERGNKLNPPEGKRVLWTRTNGRYTKASRLLVSAIQSHHHQPETLTTLPTVQHYQQSPLSNYTYGWY